MDDTRPHAPIFRAVIVGVIALVGGGCVSKVTMARARGDDGTRPHTVVLYSGVRDASRQYADYTVVDESILEDR